MNYIECREKNTGYRVLVNLDKIVSISQNDDLTAFIETNIDSEGYAIGFGTKELFVEIVKQIKQVDLLKKIQTN